MGKSNISYIDYVWNPYTNNCTKVSAGCKNCYAEEFTNRIGGTFAGRPKLRETADKLLKDIPAGQIVGINFMSDTWHEGVPLSTIQYVHQQVSERPDCIFVYTTKRAHRLSAESHKVVMPYNLWVGVSVESFEEINRIQLLKHSFARRKWISFEPLLARVGLGTNSLDGIDWVVTGAESGAKRRPFDPSWARMIGRQAHDNGIPWFHKQGSHQYPGRNVEINGQIIQEVPKEFTALKDKPVRTEDQPRLF